MAFTLKIWYAASPEDGPQVHEHLSKDMATLKGEGVRKITVEVES